LENRFPALENRFPALENRFPAPPGKFAETRMTLLTGARDKGVLPYHFCVLSIFGDRHMTTGVSAKVVI